MHHVCDAIQVDNGAAKQPEQLKNPASRDGKAFGYDGQYAAFSALACGGIGIGGLAVETSRS